jgi:hypothetical protein
MTPTPLRNIRVDDKLWLAVKKKCLKDGNTITDVIIDALRAYLKQ